MTGGKRRLVSWERARAKWMFIVSTVLTLGDGIVALSRQDYTVGILGLAAALASAAGAIATASAAKKALAVEAGGSR